MASVDEILSQYINPASIAANKRANVISASARKQMAIDPSAAQIMRTPVGDELPGDKLFNDVMAREVGVPDIDRTTREIVSDSAISAGSGFVNSTFGLAAMAAGAVNDEAGVEAANQLGAFNEVLQGYQSDTLNFQREKFARVQARDVEANRVQYEKDKKAGGGFVADLSRIGRDVFDTASNLSNNGAVALDTVASGAGSLVAAGPLIKGLKAIGGAAISSGIAARVISPGSTLVPKIIDFGSKRVAAPLAIGLQEGGGTYLQTAQEATARLADRTDLTEDQKFEMANKAALFAAASQAPIAAVIGSIPGMSNLETAPLRAAGLRDAVSKVVGETVEEAVQSGTSQASSNLGIQKFVDPSQEIAEGIGEQAALGAVGGAGAAAVVQTPGLALQATIETGKTAVRATMAGLRGVKETLLTPIIERGRKVFEENQKASPVNDVVVQQMNEAAVADAPVVAETLKEAFSKAPTEELRAEGNEYTDKILKAFQITPEDIDDPAMPEPIREAISTSANRNEAINRVADIIREAPEDQNTVLALGAVLNNLLAPIDDLGSGFMDTAALDSVPADSPVHQIIADYGKTASAIQNSGKIARAQRAVSTLLAQMAEKADPADIGDDVIQTPQGQANAQAVALTAEEVIADRLDIDKVDPDRNAQILYHASQGKVRITPAQKIALQATSALVKAHDDYLKEAEALGLKVNDFVSRGAVSGDDETDPAHYSAKQHMQQIVAAKRAGNNEFAAAALLDFSKFAQHMQNKVGAFNTFLRTVTPDGQTDADRAIKYQSLIGNPGNRKFIPSQKGLWVNPRQIGSIRKAQEIANDARAVASLVNNLVDIFPDLGVAHVKAIPLDPYLNRPAADVVSDYKQNGLSVPQDTGVETTDTATDETINVDQDQPPADDLRNADATNDEIISEKPEQKFSEDAIQKAEETPAETTQNPVVEEQPIEVAQEAPQTEENVVEPEAKLPAPRLSVSKLYPGLKGSFDKTFRRPKEDRTKIIGEAQPLEVVRRALAELPSDVAQAYADRVMPLAEELANALVENLQNFLNSSKYQNTKDKEALLRYARGRVLNVTEEQDGQIVYNDAILQTAVLAGVQWYLHADHYVQNLDADDIAGIMGVDPDLVTPLMEAQTVNGMMAVSAKRSLAGKISEYLGLDPVRDADIADIEGIPEALASEIIAAMVAGGIMETAKLNLDESVKTPIIYRPTVFVQDGDPLAKLDDAIDKAVLVKPEPTDYIGEAPTVVAETQLRNPLVRNTPEQVQALEREQKVPFLPNVSMIKLYQDFGIENLLKILGPGEIQEGQINKQHEESLKGKARSITGAYDSLTSILAKIGDGLENAQLFYRYNFTRVNRMQMLGRNNPQASKLMREAFLPTTSTIDVNDDGIRDMYFLALAQALDIKVHTKDIATSKVEVLTKLQGELKPAIDFLQSWLLGDHKLTPENAQMIKDLGIDTALGLHALVDYARFLNQEDKSKFTTQIYLEADGVTNGPVNAMVLMTPGPFNLPWLQTIRKGGLFIGQTDMTMNSYRQQPEKPGDLYENATDMLTEYMGTLRKNVRGDKPIERQLDALLRLMDVFIKDLSLDGDELVLNRGIAKNPLTITIYGSGANGIAGKLVREMVDKIYGELVTMSDERKAEILPLLTVLTQNRVGKQQGARYVSPINADRIDLSDPVSFKFNKAQLDNMTSNMRYLFVDELRTAVENTVGVPMTAAVENLRKATQVQSIFLQYAFQREVERELAKKDQKGDVFLTRSELDAIQARLRHLSPFVSNGMQNFFISGSQSTDVNARAFGSDLNETIRSPGFVDGPSDSGVSGIPFMTIGMGDGMMMLLNSLDPDAPDSLKIFDGMNLALDKVQEGSRKANEAVFKSWQGNPLQNVADSYSAFLKDFTFKDMSIDQRDALVQALYGPHRKGDDVGADRLYQDMKRVEADLRKHALEVQARHNVMKKVNLSVDQMAGAASPYQNEGEVQIDMSNEWAALSELNHMYQEELGKLTSAETVSEEISDDLKKVGRQHKSGARELSFTAVQNLVRSFKIPADQKSVYIDLLRSGATKDYKVVFGTKDQLDAYSDSTGNSRVDWGLSGGQVSGVTLVGERLIYLVNPSSETLLHELLHAATFDQIAAYYDGSISGPNSVEQVRAIKRIEELMNQFVDMEDDFNEVNQFVRTPYQDVRSTISSYLIAGDKAAALNEFMAWGLSNSALIRVQKRTVAAKIVRLGRDLLNNIKKLVFGRKLVDKPGDDMFSNLRFNTNILLRSQRVDGLVKGTMLFQSSQYGSNDRLVEINKALKDTIFTKYVDANPTARNVEIIDANIIASKVATSFNAHGFPMTMQELSTFKMVISTLATEADIDPNSLARVQDLFAYVTKTMKVEDFMNDPEANDPNDRYLAQEKFNSVMGNYVSELDKQGRSTLLPAFLALAMVNDDFRSVLQKMEVPKVEKSEGGSLDAILTNFGSSMMDKLSTRMSGEGNAANVQLALDRLIDQIIETSKDRQGVIEKTTGTVNGVLGQANDILVNGIQSLADAAYDKAKDARENSQNLGVQAIAGLVELTTAIVSEKNAEKVAEGVMGGANSYNIPHAIRRMLADMVGRTSSNAPVFDMIKRVRGAVSQNRQKYRDVVPEIIAETFSRELSKDEWTTLYRSMGKTDLASLKSGFSIEEIIQLMQDQNERDNAVNRLEDVLQTAYGNNWPLLQKKARQLAQFMNSGIPGSNLLRNAEAVANLLGETVRRGPNVTDQMVKAVDHLVTLYALESLPDSTREDLSSLAQTEVDGINFTLNYLVGQRVEEIRKSQGAARFNSYKGFIPNEAQNGVSLIVADDQANTLRNQPGYASLLQKGYVRVAPYQGSTLDPISPIRSYYYAPVSARASFNQGNLQNARKTSNGADTGTGFTAGHQMIAGRITDPRLVARIARRAHTEKGGEPLLPVYAEDGSIRAYELSVDPNQLERLNRDTDLAKMIGVWRGRQVEEVEAQVSNEIVIDTMYDMWQSDTSPTNPLGDRSSEYVDLFDPKVLDKDKVLADAMSLMTPEVRAYIRQKFGRSFLVRRDLIDDVIGYRNASVGDFWTGTSRWSDQTSETVRNLMLGVFGNKAYQRAVNAEKFVQNVVSDARLLIVVKSIAIPIANMMANTYQLIGNGVKIGDIAKGMPRKTAETNSYVQSRLREIKLEAQLRAAEGNIVETRKLNAEIQSIHDSWKRMSIWPLIQSGEFSSISDGVINAEDVELSDGKLAEYIEKLVNKLPSQGLKTTARYLMVTRDTALFKGLQKTVEYGDFLAKSVLYDHLTKNRNMSKEDALGRISEEFVNYDRLPGRDRGFVEGIGLLWFWNFKIRSVKVALSTIRNNPVHALFAGMLPQTNLFGDIGSPIEDNIFSVYLHGDLGYSTGPGMGFRSVSLNPWLNITS